jgi:hypothetical protein
LLAAGDLLSHRGQIKELTSKVADARRKAVAATKEALTEKLEELQKAVRDRFADMDAGKIDEALRPVDDLMPSAEVSLAELRSRLEVAETRCNHAAQVLEELQAAGNLARVRVSEVVTEPITSEEELDVALDRIRLAAVAELADGRQVRLQ